MDKFKLIVRGVVVLATIFFVERAYTYVHNLMGENTRLYSELVGQQQKYKQLSDHAAQLEIDYADQAKLKSDLQAKFADEKNTLTDRIKILSNATFLIREQARKEGRSDITYQGTDLKYVVNEIRFKDGPPLGYVLIFDDGRVVSRVYNHEIQVNTAVARNEDSGQYTIVSKADYVLKSPSINSNGEKVWTNKPYALKIVGGTAEIDPTEKNPLTPHFILWAPHLNGGLAIGAGASGGFVRPGIDFSVAGFGATRNDLDWKFLQIGFDIDTALQDPGMHVAPFSYRFWPQILTNTYVGPAMGWSKTGPSLQLDLSLTF